MKHTTDQIEVLDQLGETIESERPEQLDNDAELEQQLSMYESSLLQPEDI